MTSITESVHGSIPEKTYRRLRDLIVRGRISAGARIVEADVALELGVSRTPVREALARLIHERYVVPTSSGRRTQLVVAPFTIDEVRELWGIIGALEGYAVGIVATLPEQERTVIADDLRELNLALKAASQSRPRDPDKLFALQTAFHLRFVYETAGSHLRAIYDAVRPQVQRYEWIYGTRSEAQYQPSTSEHTRIIAAIRSGNATAAQASVVGHWKRAAVRTARVIDDISRSPRRKPFTSFR